MLLPPIQHSFFVFIPQHQFESQKGLSAANYCHQVQEHSRPWRLVHIDTMIQRLGMKISCKKLTVSE